MRAVTIIYGGGSWVNVRARDTGRRGRSQNVRQQGFSLRERRWAVTNMMLSDDERAQGLELLSDLEIMQAQFKEDRL